MIKHITPNKIVVVSNKILIVGLAVSEIVLPDKYQAVLFNYMTDRGEFVTAIYSS